MTSIPRLSPRVSADTQRRVATTVNQLIGTSAPETSPQVIFVKHLGVSPSNDEATNTAIIDDILAQNLPGALTLVFPTGVIPCRVRVPILAHPELSVLTIRGDTSAVSWFGTVDGDGSYAGGYAGSPYGTVLTSSETTASTESGGIIEVLNASDWNIVRLNVQDINLRTYDNPQQHGIMAWWAVQLTCDRVNIDTGAWPTDMATEPSIAYGIRTPRNNNGALTRLNDVSITGYFVGLEASEHTIADCLQLTACRYGIEFAAADHASKFGRVCIQRCQVPIVASGSHRFIIQQLDLEHANPAIGTASGGITTPGNTAVGCGWQVTTTDISDAGNVLQGRVNHHVVLGGVGIDDTGFSKMGGGLLNTVRVGRETLGNYPASDTGLRLTGWTYTSGLTDPGVEVGYSGTTGLVYAIDRTTGNNEDLSLWGKVLHFACDSGSGTPVDVASISTTSLNINSSKTINFASITDAADDAAAATAGVALGDVYRTGSALKVRVV